MFAINSIMFGLPIASSTDATTTSKGFGDVMLHRCMLTWRVCMFVFLRRGPKRLEDRRSPQSLMQKFACSPVRERCRRGVVVPAIMPSEGVMLPRIAVHPRFLLAGKARLYLPLPTLGNS